MKPILFNTEMVRAILDGRKTTTRRVIKGIALDWLTKGCFTSKFVASPDNYLAPYTVGDVLYVRETFTELCRTDENGYTHYNESFYLYAADSLQIDLYDGDGFLLDDQRIKWHPSIHMPKEAARIFLRVTDVRAERLQDITEDGAKAEGTDADVQIAGGYVLDGYYRSRFATHLWNTTVKKSDIDKYGWEANPFVWVISFERCKKPKDEN
jgi:hypothetical protein